MGIPALPDLRADEITAVLAGAGAVFTTSMHAAIVGASFGTPVIVPGVGKTSDAFAVLPNPPRLHSRRRTPHCARRCRPADGQTVDPLDRGQPEAVVAAFRGDPRAAELV